MAQCLLVLVEIYESSRSTPQHAFDNVRFRREPIGQGP